MAGVHAATRSRAGHGVSVHVTTSPAAFNAQSGQCEGEDRLKKSFGVTTPAVSRKIASISARDGVISPFTARVIVESETEQRAAKRVAVSPDSAM